MGSETLYASSPFNSIISIKQIKKNTQEYLYFSTSYLSFSSLSWSISSSTYGFIALRNSNLFNSFYTISEIPCKLYWYDTLTL